MKLVLFFILFGIILCQRPPRARPPSDQLNYDCLAATQLPRYTPILDRETSGRLECPQSDTTYWFMLRFLEQFKQYYPNIEIIAPVIGSGIAGPCLTNSSCNMSVIAREMLLAEVIPFINYWGYKPFEVPIAGGSYAALAYTDAMTVMVHPSNPLSQLSFMQFDSIFSTTRNRGGIDDIQTWGQLGVTHPEYKDRKINLYGVAIPNGFEYYLNRTILLGGTWKTNITTRSTVFELATLVSHDPYGIGYTGLAYLNATVKQLSLTFESGWPYTKFGEIPYYSPDKPNVCRRDYPLARLIYLYAHKEPGKQLNPLILEFLNFILSYEGQKAIQDDMIFLPLPVTVVLNVRKQIGLV